MSHELDDLLTEIENLQLDESQQTSLYLDEREWEVMSEALETMESGEYVPRKLRSYFCKLIISLEITDGNKDLIEYLEKPTSKVNHAAKTIRKRIVEICKKWKPVLLEFGKREANRYLLKNGSLNPTFLQYFSHKPFSFSPQLNWQINHTTIEVFGDEDKKDLFFLELADYDKDGVEISNVGFKYMLNVHYTDQCCHRERRSTSHF